MSDEYYAGKGCKCYAYSELECVCDDVDWTDPEIYELRKDVKELKRELNALATELGVRTPILQTELDEIANLVNGVDSGDNL